MTIDFLIGLFIIVFLLVWLCQYIYINEREFEKRKKRLYEERNYENSRRKL